MKITLKYVGLDSWSRPVYKDDNGRLFVDTDPKSNREPHICTKYNNAFDAEPDTPIEYLKEYENAEIEFIPKRIVWD